MNNKGNSNLGDEIRDMVEKSIQQMDFKELNQKISSTINGAISEAKSAMEDVGLAPKKQVKKNQVVQQRPKEIIIPYKEKGNVSGTVSSVFGGIGLFLFGTAMIVFFILAMVFGVKSVFTYLLFGFLPLLFGSIFLFGNGIRLSRQAKRSKRYFFFLREKGYCSVESISQRMGLPTKKVREDIKKMLAQGIFPQGALDEQETCFIGNREYYSQYQEALESYKQRMALDEQKKIMVQSENKQDGLCSQADSALHEGKVYLEEIQKVQKRIYEPEFSGKLQRLQTVIEQIFQHVRKYPQQIDEIRKFMDYYLPTTLKLVKAYENFSSQPIQGENITQAKKEIEETVGTINEAFERLLDSLYEDVTMDVSTDISVLHTMLAQEGLTESDFKKQ